MQYSENTSPGAPKSNKNVLLYVLFGACSCVVLIIPLTIALLYPAFRQARDKGLDRAHAQMCLTNVKQMSLGVIFYVQDYDETFPRSKNWMTDLKPYIKNAKVFHCPSVSTFNEGGGGAEFGYAFNSPLSSLSLAKLDHPAQTGMIFDSSTLTENASDPLTSLPTPSRHNHETMNTFGYVDGHCKLSTADQLARILQNQPK